MNLKESLLITEKKDDERKKRLSWLKKKITKFMAAGLALEASGLGLLSPAMVNAGQEVENRDTTEMVKTSDANEQTKKLKDDLTKLFGPSGAPFIERYIDHEESAPDRKNVETNAVDLESITSQGETKIDKDLIRRFLDTMPDNWVDGEVSSIRQINLIYQGHEGVIASCRRCNENYEEGLITLYKVTEDKSPQEILIEVIVHELAHANDWESDNELTYEERVQLANNIIGRVRSPDHYSSWYIEYLASEGVSLYRMSIEYWAEICRQYFKNPFELHVDDFIIVDAQVRKNDSEYNWVDAITERNNILSSLAFENNTTTEK
jgi:hypothetical protein